MFNYLVSKIARPLPVVEGDDQKKFNIGVRALNRSLTASNPSAKKRQQNEKKNRKKPASPSSPVPAPTSLVTPAPTVSTRKRSIADVEQTPKPPAPKRKRVFVTPAIPSEEEDNSYTNMYHYQTTEFVGWRRVALVEKVTAEVGAFYIMVIPAYKDQRDEAGTCLDYLYYSMMRRR